MPKEIESLVGRSLEDSLVTKYPADKEKTALLHRYAAAIGLPDAEKLRFHVVASAQVNAFAVMGGSIFVFEPMLDTVESSDEFAALLFHEYAHVKNRHTSRTTMRTLAAYLFLSVIINDTSGIVAALMQNLETLQSLDYSRDFEREADAEAVLMLAERGMDHDAFAVLMEHLDAETSDTFRMTEFLSSHPDAQERINSARSLAEKYRITPPSATVAVGDHRAIWAELEE
jgi:predicted Zn-dependent protease